jgi:hypothetical protein
MKHLLSLLFLTSFFSLNAFGVKDCEQLCKTDGRCALSAAGICEPTQNSHCRESDKCKTSGKCKYAVGGVCVANSEADCLASEDCKEHGNCHRQENYCVPNSEEDCRRSTSCERLKKCEFYAGAINSCLVHKSRAACPSEVCDGPRSCRDMPCAADLYAEGWKTIATCDTGDNWSSIREKGSKRMHCTGANMLGGPSDIPCTPFTGDLKEFTKEGCKISK